MDEVKLLNNYDRLEPLELNGVYTHLAYCFLNAAAVLMRQRNFNDAVYSCTKALEYDPASAKGYFRRAQESPRWCLFSLFFYPKGDCSSWDC